MDPAALHNIFVKYATDKSSHDYARTYARCIPDPLKVRSVLEIGVFIGSSVQAWAEAFPNAVIFGFDNDLSKYKYQPHERVVLIKGDQGNVQDLRKILTKCNHFDLIVDDGSHQPAHQELGLNTLFQSLNPGGLYAIEDLHFGTSTTAVLADNAFYIQIGNMCASLVAWESLPIGSAKVNSISIAPKICILEKA